MAHATPLHGAGSYVRPPFGRALHPVGKYDERGQHLLQDVYQNGGHDGLGTGSPGQLLSVWYIIGSGLLPERQDHQHDAENDRQDRKCCKQGIVVLRQELRRDYQQRSEAQGNQ